VGPTCAYTGNGFHLLREEFCSLLAMCGRGVEEYGKSNPLRHWHLIEVVRRMEVWGNYARRAKISAVGKEVLRGMQGCGNYMLTI
jgi:hypothetical protein